MSDPGVAIARAAVDRINGHAFSVPLPAALVYSLDANLVTTSALAATVMLLGLETEFASRREDKEIHTIGIALHQVVSTRDAATIEGLLSVAREVRELFAAARLADGVVIRQRSDQPYDYEALRQRRQFLSFLELDVQRNHVRG